MTAFYKVKPSKLSVMYFPGLFLICALVLFPAGWGSNDVKYECGGTSSAFNVSTTVSYFNSRVSGLELYHYRFWIYVKRS